MAKTLAAEDQVLIAELYPVLRRFAATVGSYDIEPDDLVQEALLRTVRVRRLSELDNPRAYLSRAIVNIASNERRTLGRMRNAFLRAIEPSSIDDTYPSDLDDLEALDPRSRAVLYLIEVEGYDFETVGRMIGVRGANARKIAERSRYRLRRLVEEGSA